MWSDHAPVRLTLEIADSGIKTFNSSDDNIFHSTYRWDPDKITEMKTSLISHMDTMSSNVEQMVCTEQSIENTVIKLTETLNTVFKPFCEKRYCIKRNATNIKSNKNSLPNKPWFDDRCKELYYIYHCNIRRFNRNRNNLNRQILIESKKNYKSYENRVKRNYLRYEGNQIDYWRKHNPKQFFDVFKKGKKNTNCNLKSSDFYNHFKNLTAETSPNITDDVEADNQECVYNELDASITQEEVCKSYGSLSTQRVFNIFPEESTKCDSYYHSHIIEYSFLVAAIPVMRPKS
ncbi:unnamed protein product [Mytilus edulis]|uniref:Uncharacterized protein n=1 Tax=Mytilus edulis TaxID=6550 RepID=A0A8S3T038_MYTED|nr:unnamed protein product [Mytilus edulis]